MCRTHPCPALAADSGPGRCYTRNKPLLGRRSRGTRIAVKFNESTDSKEKLRLLGLIEPYDAAMSAHIKRSQALQKKSEKVDALYAQIDIEREKENQRRSA